MPALHLSIKHYASSMGVVHVIVLLSTLELVPVAAKDSQPCLEAHSSQTGHCNIVDDAATSGASLLQSNKVSATLGEAVDVAGPTNFDPEPSRVGLPSLALLQAFSSGSGTKHFSEPNAPTFSALQTSQVHRPIRRQPPAAMMNIERQGRTLKVDTRAKSTFFYLVPMGVSLAASCMLLGLVYCVARGDRIEDESLSRVLVGLGKRGGEAPKPPQVQAQAARREELDSARSTSAASSSPGSSVSTEAAAPAKSVQEAKAEKQEAEEEPQTGIDAAGVSSNAGSKEGATASS